MDYNRLGRSGLRVPALSFGTATFGGGNDFFKAWGSTDAGGAARLIDICLDHGVSLFDTADVYSHGLAEQILGEAIKGKRDRLTSICCSCTARISIRRLKKPCPHWINWYAPARSATSAVPIFPVGI